MRRVLLGMAMISIAVAAPVGALAGDQEIAQHILKRIDAEKKAGNLRGFDINMQVDAGKVVLTGQVANEQQLQTLLKIASHTSHLGTERVFNRLRIAEPPQSTVRPQEKKSTFPNLLAVFQSNPHQQTAIEAAAHEVAGPSSHDEQELAGNETQAQLSSRRTFQRRHGAAMQAKSQLEPDKRPTSNHLVQRLAPATREAPGSAHPVGREVELASNEYESGVPQSIAAPAIRLAPAPAHSPIRPTQLSPIPRQDTTPPLSEQQLAQLQQLRLAQLQQMQWQQMQQAQLASNQMPVAFAPAGPGSNGMAASPMAAPNYMPASNGPAIHHDHPNMPPYAWPGYAAHPNYAALTYPKQYSPSAWPYIGPFYPYPQVPLGWRKVQLEWDDGWWFLNFKNRHFR